MAFLHVLLGAAWHREAVPGEAHLHMDPDGHDRRERAGFRTADVCHRDDRVQLQWRGCPEDGRHYGDPAKTVEEVEESTVDKDGRRQRRGKGLTQHLPRRLVGASLGRGDTDQSVEHELGGESWEAQNESYIRTRTERMDQHVEHEAQEYKEAQDVSTGGTG